MLKNPKAMAKQQKDRCSPAFLLFRPGFLGFLMRQK
jgi:hypothetical protein